MTRTWALGARLLLVLLLAVFVAACTSDAPSAGAPLDSNATATSANAQTPEAGDAEGTEGVLGATGSRYTLRTIAGTNGRLMYIGTEGAVAGRVNPTLTVSPGQTVEITLVSGDAGTHDIVAPDVGLQSEAISGDGATTTVTFTAPDESGTYPYWSSEGNDRELGMEGEIVVG